MSISGMTGDWDEPKLKLDSKVGIVSADPSVPTVNRVEVGAVSFQALLESTLAF